MLCVLDLKLNQTHITVAWGRCQRAPPLSTGCMVVVLTKVRRGFLGSLAVCKFELYLVTSLAKMHNIDLLVNSNCQAQSLSVFYIGEEMATVQHGLLASTGSNNITDG